jgi:ribosomal protein S18 acetylase RimI-like enzyme
MQIRRCRSEDLLALEWDGEFSHDRDIIAWAFSRSLANTMVMLVAENDDDHAGQVWIDFERRRGVAYVWALRVKPAWQRRGVATRLLAATERTSLARRIFTLELDVEPANQTARRLYEQLGYAHVRSDLLRAPGGRVAGCGLLGFRKVLSRGDHARAVMALRAD